MEQKRSQLVVGLDPRLDLLPLELRGDAHIGRPAAAEATARFCCGIIDAVAPYAVAVKPQLAFFEVLGRRRDRRLRAGRPPTRARPGLLVIVDGKRGDIGSTARAYADAYLEPRRGPRAGRRRPDREHVSRPRLARAVRRRLPAGRRRALLPRQDVERRQRRRPGPGALRRPPALAAGRAARAASSARSSSATVGSRASAPSSAPPIRARSARRGGCCRRRSCSCPASVRRARRPADIARAFTSGPASALVNASRSVMYAFREGEEDWRAAAAAEAARLSHEVWAVSGW